MIQYDPGANAVYIPLTVRSALGIAVKQVVLEDLVSNGEVIVDFDSDGRICGIEILGASYCLEADLLDSLEEGGTTA